MWLIAVVQKRKYSTRGYKFLNFKFSGSLRRLQNRELEEQVVQDLATAIDFIQQLYSQNYNNTVILK